MSTSPRLRIGLALACVVGLCVPCVHGEEQLPAVELVGVPTRLTFPMEAGSNVFLTARVALGNVRQVWLSPYPAFPGRVMLVRTGDDTYQINLAEEVVYRLLQANRKKRLFQVFAETEGRDILESLPIAYKLADAEEEAVAKGSHADARVWTEGQEEAPPMGSRRGPYMHRAQFPDNVWLSPGYTRRIWFSCDVSYRAFLVSGEKEWPMKPVDGEKARLEVDADIANTIRRARTAKVAYVLEGSRKRAVVELKVAPEQLDLPGEAGEITLAEYESGTVPGSEGYLIVSVGNIGGHRTLLSLRGADGRPFIRQTPVTLNSRKAFEYGKTRYVVEVKLLSQSVFGEDFAVLAIKKELVPESQNKSDRTHEDEAP